MKPYYDNSHLCVECTGDGCKRCDGTGSDRWPLSHALQAAFPPAIANFAGAPLVLKPTHVKGASTYRFVNKAAFV